MKTSYKFNSSKDDIIVDIGICTCLMLKTLDLDYKELEADERLKEGNIREETEQSLFKIINDDPIWNFI
ncbi:hypothetical protein RhiirA5_417170 [Rhizophagus irregularis]|uniref:Uncharacterized protein n=1 Tax=Rhizophagus irregularis TaxID=588596 RepID=A0A2N0PN22_9GLOM|nr:hypothetical protein RhiirA5_417170 [Rhizophagus irregularis]